MQDIVTSLKVRAAQAGTNLSEVCRRAGVTRSTVSRWENRPPNTFVILGKLEAAINQIATEKRSSNEGVSGR